MIELTTKAENYAAEKTNEVMVKAIAQAYADGYRDGYKDREEEIPVDLRDNKTEYVDLGLPSGTLWAADYEKIGKKLYVPYCQISMLNIPSEKQWNELFEICKWTGNYSSSGDTFYGILCIGPNGNSIKFRPRGYMIDEEKTAHINGGGHIYFWIKDNEIGNEKNAVHVSAGNRRIDEHTRKRIPEINITKVFSGYKLPVRLVRTK